VSNDPYEHADALGIDYGSKAPDAVSWYRPHLEVPLDSLSGAPPEPPRDHRITQVSLPPQSFDVWHDRAVFHFLTELTQREAYVRSVLNAVRPGGYVIVSTFGPEGPAKFIRYDAEALQNDFG
jgi:SAM-dependent methyltransferase